MSGTSGLTAQRFEGKPLTQPTYSFRDVPKCSRDLADSSITYVDRRDPFVDSMAEMILLTKECMRRQAEMQEADAVAAASKGGRRNRKKSCSSKKARRHSEGGKGGEGEKKRTSKPLSLEYMADRTGEYHGISFFHVESIGIWACVVDYCIWFSFISISAFAI
jgi:hypothetical protein